MLAQTIFVALLAASPVPAAEPVDVRQVLALRTGQLVLVDSYRLDGHLLRAETADGPLVMRAEKADLELSATLTAVRAEQQARRAAAALEAAEAAAAALQAQQARRAEMQARHRLTATGGYGTLSVAGGSAFTDTAPDEQDRGRPRGNQAEDDSPSPATPEGQRQLVDIWRPRFETLKSRYRSTEREIDRTAREHNRLSDQHNATYNQAERDIARNQMAPLRSKLTDLRQRLRTIESEYARTKEDARRAGVPPIASRGGLG